MCVIHLCITICFIYGGKLFIVLLSKLLFLFQFHTKEKFLNIKYSLAYNKQLINHEIKKKCT